MNQYYLMSQLPSLDAVSDGMALPISWERFYELCSRFLSKKAMAALDALTLKPPRHPSPSGFSVIDSWNSSERLLRLALGAVRAERMKKSFDTEGEMIPIQLLQVSRIASESEDPLSAENFLNKHRLETLESLRPADAFSEESVFHYGLKLKLIERMRRFDTERGQAAYRNIYGSILNGDVQEAE